MFGRFVKTSSFFVRRFFYNPSRLVKGLAMSELSITAPTPHDVYVFDVDGLLLRIPLDLRSCRYARIWSCVYDGVRHVLYSPQPIHDGYAMAYLVILASIRRRRLDGNTFDLSSYDGANLDCALSKLPDSLPCVVYDITGEFDVYA